MNQDSATPASFLARLSAGARDRLLAVARPVAFESGAALVHQGESARGAFVLREGEVEAAVRLPGGESHVVGRLGPGAIFGEMALIERGSCTATVSARSPVEGWFVEYEDFRVLASQRDAPAIELQHAVAAILAERVRALNAKVIACPSPEDRPARAFEPGADPLAGVARTKQADFDLRAFLPRLPVFDRFSAGELDEMLAAASVLTVARGTALFVPGGPATAAFVIVRGAAEIVSVREGREKRLAVLGPGQLVGHMSVLEGGRHSALAAAREEALFLEWEGEAFRRIYAGASSAGARLRLAVHKSLLGSLGATNRVLSRLVNQSKLAASAMPEDLEAAYHGQFVTSDH